MEYLTRVFPGQTEFLDLKDAPTADLNEARLAGRAEFPGLAGSGAPRGIPQFDAASPELEHLRQRRLPSSNGETSRQMFPGAAIEAITNGVHAGTWTSPPFQQLFDRYIPSWRGGQLQFA